MVFHRWSALFRAYDITWRLNQWILLISIAGAFLGLVLASGDMQSRLLVAAVVGITAFAAAALAKEFDPDRPQSAWMAAIAVLPFAGNLAPSSVIILFWLVASVRFVNRSTGLRPKWFDTLVLLAATAWLAAFVSPLFGLLAGTLLMLDAFLADGQKNHVAIGFAAIILAIVSLLLGDWPVGQSPAWLVVSLLAITIALIPIIINYFDVESVGDATGEKLNSLRVQAGQVFSLSTGLFLASWLGESGALLQLGLWAALLGVLMHRLVFCRIKLIFASH